MVSEVVGMMLEDEHTSFSVTTEAEALARLRDGPERFDAILLDCLLPGGQPQTLIEEARRLGLPVVLMSGDVRMAQAYGPSHVFLKKPFARTTLLEAIASALSKEGCCQ